MGEDPTGPMGIQPTPRQSSVLHTHLPNIVATIMAGEITVVDTTGPQIIGEAEEITNNPTDAIMAPIIISAKEARNTLNSLITNNPPTIMDNPSINYMRRKHLNSQIDIKDPRESQIHLIRNTRTY